jgi:hypothetical protein
VFQNGFNYHDPRYKIYYSHIEKVSINKLLGIIPYAYLEEYDECILKESSPYSLINVIHVNSIIYSNDIIYFNREKNSRQILKGYPPKILSSQTQIESFDQHVATLIDITVFNDYIECRNKLEDTLTHGDIISHFAYLLSVPEDSTSYKRIYSKNDLLQLIKDRPIIQGYEEWFGDRILTLDSINIKQRENEAFYWYSLKGVVWFRFEFIPGTNKILKVDSKIVGYLGNENTSCC